MAPTIPSTPQAQPARPLPPPGSAHAVVIGGGTMGVGIATSLSRARCHTTLVEPRTARRELLPTLHREQLRQLGHEGPAAPIEYFADLDAVCWDPIDLVIECIPEALAPKQALFAQLAACAPPQALLCSNSSAIPISRIADGLDTRHRMLGLHYFMPAHLVPLVEVIMGAGTDPRLAQSLMAFMRACGKVPVLVRKDLPGFLANRLQHALGREALALVDAGVASIEDVDAAVRFGFGFRYLAAGPLMQRDHAGLDVHHAAATTMYPSLSASTVPGQALASRVQAGRLGMKTGDGFYHWTPGGIDAERARYDNVLAQALHLLADELPPLDPAPHDTTPP